MRKSIILSLLFISFISITAQEQPAIPISSYGIWDRGGYFLGAPTNAKYSYFRGVQLELVWSTIQPTNATTFDWRSLDNDLATCNKYSKNAYVNILVGPDCPAWVYANGVPKVLTDQTTQFNGQFPFYLNANYKTYFYKLISEFGKHIRTLSPALRSRVSFMQVMTGCTGDEVAYKGNILDNNYNITASQWLDFRLAAFSKFKAAFHDGDQTTVIPMLFNNIDPDNNQTVEWKWVQDSIGSDFGFKGSAYPRGHHLTGELPFKNTWNPYQINPKGMVLFSRAEMDQSCTKTMYNLNPKIGFYWGILSGLNTGLSVHDQSANATDLALADPDIMSSILFFNKYAGQIFPSTATAAYSIFHEGLNSNNLTKFPKSYGQCTSGYLSRYQNICQAYQAQGAQLDDTLAVVQGQVYQRDKQTGYNDAGWDIEEGNYERWITQIDADATSVGRFRLRGPLTIASSKYDRFARSFQNSKSKNTMYFKFHNELFSATNQPKSLSFSITWLDSTAGSTWEFRYRNTKGVLTTALKTTGLGDKQWKTITLSPITDMDVTHTGALGSDFMLVNTDIIDDIFNGIEVDIVRQSAQTALPEILKNKVEDEIQIYPNPTKSVVNIQSTEQIKSVELLDLNGKSILNKWNDLENSIDLSTFKNGIYFMRIALKNKVLVKKVTKE